MTKEEYHQLLKDGRWQRRRLEIMQRDDFKCRECGTTNDLNVHHIRYIAGRKPWEYDDGDLITLCGDCHKKTHELIEQERDEIDAYFECEYRAKQIDGLFVYYKQIGDLHDVITTIRVNANDYPALTDLDMFWRCVMPYSESWAFSACAGANGPTLGTQACNQVHHHVWHNDPDAILTKEQFENVRQGFNIDKESMDKEEWDFLNSYYFDYAEKKYNSCNSCNSCLKIVNLGAGFAGIVKRRI
jgi:hypothetical protein